MLSQDVDTFEQDLATSNSFAVRADKSWKQESQRSYNKSAVRRTGALLDDVLFRFFVAATETTEM